MLEGVISGARWSLQPAFAGFATPGYKHTCMLLALDFGFGSKSQQARGGLWICVQGAVHGVGRIIARGLKYGI